MVNIWCPYIQSYTEFQSKDGSAEYFKLKAAATFVTYFFILHMFYQILQAVQAKWTVHLYTSIYTLHQLKKQYAILFGLKLISNL